MIVGLTGGIGAGKSTVAEIFKKLGIPVYNSDQRAKDLYAESKVLKSKMQHHFGTDIYIGNEINRAKLAEIVFKDTGQLQVLNGFVHPLLQKDFEYWNEKQTALYVVREAAILIESGAHKSCKFVIVVTADEALRIERVMSRDNVSKEQVNQRITNQISEKERLGFADFVIVNNSEDLLIKQVSEVDKKLRNFGTSSISL